MVTEGREGMWFGFPLLGKNRATVGAVTCEHQPYPKPCWHQPGIMPGWHGRCQAVCPAMQMLTHAFPRGAAGHRPAYWALQWLSSVCNKSSLLSAPLRDSYSWIWPSHDCKGGSGAGVGVQPWWNSLLCCRLPGESLLLLMPWCPSVLSCSQSHWEMKIWKAVQINALPSCWELIETKRLSPRPWPLLSISQGSISSRPSLCDVGLQSIWKRHGI